MRRCGYSPGGTTLKALRNEGLFVYSNLQKFSSLINYNLRILYLFSTLLPPFLSLLNIAIILQFLIKQLQQDWIRWLVYFGRATHILNHRATSESVGTHMRSWCFLKYMDNYSTSRTITRQRGRKCKSRYTFCWYPKGTTLVPNGYHVFF